MNLFIVYELETWSRDLSTDFTLGECLFGAVKSTRNADPGKYSGYVTGFDAGSRFLFPNSKWDENIVIICINNSSSMHTENRKKDY